MYASIELGARPLDFKCLGHVALGHASNAEAEQQTRLSCKISAQRLFVEYVYKYLWLAPSSLLDF
jgi:hypothetical protein